MHIFVIILIVYVFFFQTLLDDLYMYPPEEATVVDDSGAVGGGAVADLGWGGVEARKTIIFGEIVSALKHSICENLSYGLLCCAKLLAVIANISSKVWKCCVDIRIEILHVASVVWTAPTVYKICLWITLCTNITAPQHHR